MDEMTYILAPPLCQGADEDMILLIVIQRTSRRAAADPER
jgi:hypothetical protein